MCICGGERAEGELVVELGGGEGLEVGCYCGGYDGWGGIGERRVGCAAWECG